MVVRGRLQVHMIMLLQESGKKLVDMLTIDHYSIDYLYARNTLMSQYGYGIFADGQDYNMTAAEIFNPYYSISDIVSWMKSESSNIYLDFLNSDEFTKFSLTGRNEYQIPYYNINGDRDYQCNYVIAQEYFDLVEAPNKKMYIMNDTTHGLLESKSEDFSLILHEIAQMEQSK